MRTTVVLCLFAMASFAFAIESTSSLAALLAMKAQASGAIDSAMQVLYDLKKASLTERDDLENRNKTEEAEGTRNVAELTQILNVAETNYQNAVAHRQFIETEVEDTEKHIQWIENRLAEIERKLEELAVQRCAANALFVQSLKEHADAEKAIKVLEAEIQRMSAAGELAQIQSLTEKFQLYGHLFEQDALNSFVQLANEKVDDITGFQDNNKGALELQGPDTNPNQRNLKGTLVQKVLAMLTKLLNHLAESRKNLEVHEIQAAYDYANFKAQSEVENVTLRADHERKEAYLAKLEIDVEVARENEDRTLGIRDGAQIDLDSAVQDLEIKREFYAQESARIREDLAVMDEVINIFQSRVANMQDVLSKRIDQHQDGQAMGGIGSQAGDLQKQWSGNLKNVV